jgi:drug/metabolite transporter (DMT)-like permease
MTPTAKAVPQPSRSIATYIWLGMMAQMIWGAYPVTAKRAMLEVPKFSLLFFATFATMLAGLWLMYRTEKRSWQEAFAVMLRTKSLWGLAFFVIARSVSNILAVEMTRATWVQLIYLMTPFMVAILGSLVFGIRTPRYTYRALLLSSFGAAMVLIEDWSHIFARFSAKDGWGLLIATFSMMSLATYFLMIRRNRQGDIGRGMILFQQSLVMTSTYLVLTLVTGEDWGRWMTASPQGWMYAISIITIIQIGGNSLQITAIGGASPALITSLMPLRLISALILGWLILGEHLTTVWQWAGAIIVLVTVSGYLWLQSRDSFSSAL